jgi:hypothetical protein
MAADQHTAPQPTQTVFVSVCEPEDPEVVRFVAALAEHGFRVSPSSPPGGAGPEWDGWYDHGCRRPVDSCDAFVAVVTQAYDSSTWMAHEADEAQRRFDAGAAPALLLLPLFTDRPLPAGFSGFESKATRLANDPLAAAKMFRDLLRSAGDPR